MSDDVTSIEVVTEVRDSRMPIGVSDVTAEMLLTHAMNGAQRQADNTETFRKLSELDYLEQKRKVDFREATAMQEARVSGLARESAQGNLGAVAPLAVTGGKTT